MRVPYMYTGLSALALLVHAGAAQKVSYSDTTGLTFYQGTKTQRVGGDPIPTGVYHTYSSKITLTGAASSNTRTVSGSGSGSGSGSSTNVSVSFPTGSLTTGANLTATATGVPQPTNTQPCNNYLDFCSRKYSNITQVGCHNSPFVRPGNSGSNQELPVKTQLDDGVRFLQGQMQWPANSSVPHFCHTTCDLLDAGPITDWLGQVYEWVDAHPYDVVTILLENGNYSDPSLYVPFIQQTGILKYTFVPTVFPMGISDWPTLEKMIIHGSRVVMFLDYKANQTAYPWLMDEFSQMWETTFDPVDRAFPCTVQRPPDLSTESAVDRLYLMNHNLNAEFNVFSLELLVPAVSLLNETNAAEGYGSVGLAANNCRADWGRAPNVLNVDYYNYGSPSGSVFEAAARLNNVTYNGTYSEYDHRNSLPPSPYAYGPNSYSPASSWSGSFSYSGSGGGGYAPLLYGQGGPPSRGLSKGSREPSYSSVQQTFPESIKEEETYDLSLLKAAAPMGTSTSSTTWGRYAAIYEEEDGYDAGPAFDLTATLGPLSLQDDAFIKKLQEHEARGNLTGGLGQGFRAGSQLRSGELLSSPTSVQRNLSRSFSRRNPSRRLNRAETLRHMGQDEANRRGEVIEVILEEPVGADLSNIEGPNIASGGLRQSTYPIREKMTQTFYPQPNWKPFSMRWPYLSSLILLSVALAVMQEVLFQMHRKEPLVKFTSPAQVKQGIYFIIKFAPTLLAVIYGVLWQFTDFEVRRLEAFYQLSKEGGAVAAESINIDYATSFNFFRPFRAFRKGHYAVAVSCTATILAVSLVPTFAAAAVVLSPTRTERMANPDGDKTLNFSSVWSRLLTSTLGVIAVLGCVLFYLLQSRKSGLMSDVRGIAGLASMAVVSHILMDFKDMDTAPHGDIHDRLKYNRYMLRNSSLAPDDSNPVTSKEREKSNDHDLPANPHPVLLRPVGIIPMIVGIFLFIGFIPAFLFTPATIVTDKAPWVVTVLAVGLKMAWGGMETGVRMLEPYYILSRRHAPANTLLLDYTALPFGYMPVRALLNGHLLVFFVGFGSVMAEFLTVLVAGLATVDGHDFLLIYSSTDGAWEINSGTETVKSFYVSVALSLFILLYMAAVAFVVFFRRRHSFLPRQPNTIASVLAYIHQSKMLYDFVGTEKFTSSQVRQRLGEYKRYGLGWFVGRDGQKHCGVDQEELISNYKHGISLKQGTQPWNMQWDVL
ncbi:hypothetical protein V8C37DRAFT_407466 [Trichoderma ceciliae]